ncbi:MAG: hypothetical protein V3T33_02270 [Myxococcota bacterium]
MSRGPALRRVQATLTSVTSVHNEAGRGVLLSFRPNRGRLGVECIEDFAQLGPEFDLAAVDGLGKVLRILRAARIALDGDPRLLIEGHHEVTTLLERAVGTPLRLALRPRSRIRFKAWTEDRVETVDDVVQVHEASDAFLVVRHRGRFPVRVPRESVVRHQTECERWYEVVGIERL